MKKNNKIPSPLIVMIIVTTLSIFLFLTLSSSLWWNPIVNSKYADQHCHNEYGNQSYSDNFIDNTYTCEWYTEDLRKRTSFPKTYSYKATIEKYKQ